MKNLFRAATVATFILASSTFGFAQKSQIPAQLQFYMYDFYVMENYIALNLVNSVFCREDKQPTEIEKYIVGSIIDQKLSGGEGEYHHYFPDNTGFDWEGMHAYLVTDLWLDEPDPKALDKTEFKFEPIILEENGDKVDLNLIAPRFFQTAMDQGLNLSCRHASAKLQMVELAIKDIQNNNYDIAHTFLLQDDTFNFMYNNVNYKELEIITRSARTYGLKNTEFFFPLTYYGNAYNVDNGETNYPSIMQLVQTGKTNFSYDKTLFETPAEIKPKDNSLEEVVKKGITSLSLQDKQVLFNFIANLPNNNEAIIHQLVGYSYQIASNDSGICSYYNSARIQQQVIDEVRARLEFLRMSALKELEDSRELAITAEYAGLILQYNPAEAKFCQ